nr:selenoprotein W-like [Odocoileus virginianus texanus]
MAVVVRVVYWACSLKHLELKKKLEDEFPSRLDICGEGTPQVTGFFEVFVAGKLVHSKKGGDGYVDTESKFLKLVAAIKSCFGSGPMCPEGKDQ